jgi:Concanavalin A-like lectin/glucanases superfamily/Putative Ig domain
MKMRIILTITMLLVWALLVTNSLGQSCAPPPPGIIAWWPLDEISGTVVADIGGGNPGASVNSPVPTPGQVGNALRFNGGNYIGVSDSDLWAFGTQDFTIELWVNFDTSPGGSIDHPDVIFIGNDEGPGNVNKWFFALGGGFLNFHINSPTIGPKFFPLVPFSPNLNQWYHLAVTRNGSTYTLYIDGVPGGSATNIDVIPNPNAPLTIGQAESLGFMKGRLDEITIYNRTLNQTELQAIVNAGTAGKCKQLTITTASLSVVQLEKFFSQQLEARFGQPPYIWSITYGVLPSGITLNTEGILSGMPTEAGDFVFTVRVTDSADTYAEKILTLTDLVTLPPPDIRITKTGTTAVPGRVLDYFILVENLGATIAADVGVSEFLEPWFTFISSNPPPMLITDSEDLFPPSSIGGTY